MAYFLRAIIASKSDIERCERRPLVNMVDLPQSYCMIPITVKLLTSIYDQTDSHSYIQGFQYLEASTLDYFAKLFAYGTFALVENDTFGGVGEQSSLVWKDRECIFGPVHTVTNMFEPYSDENVPLEYAAINQALHTVGVVKEAIDEFSALGLGRHRNTEGWVS